MTISLPTERSTPEQNFGRLFTLIYGEPKIGKSTLASTFPDPLFIKTEEGLRLLSVFEQKCTSWSEFREIIVELRKPESKERYKTIVIDTVDILYQQCENHICEAKGIAHPSEEDWGKGWQMVRDEFQKGMGYLAAEGYGIIFISHTKTIERTIRGRKIPSIVPSMTGQARKVVLPLVDFMLFLSPDIDAPENAGIRRLYCRNTIEFECGSRESGFPDAIDEISYDGIQEAFAYARSLKNKKEGTEDE